MSKKNDFPMVRFEWKYYCICAFIILIAWIIGDFNTEDRREREIVVLCEAIHNDSTAIDSARILRVYPICSTRR